MKIHLITYGDEKFLNAKKRIYNEANTTGWFDTVTVYGPENLDDDFKAKFKNILKEPKGGGYWIWKSHIIQKKLNEINDNDILIYLDAGCSINPKGEERLSEYIEMLNKGDEGIISFRTGHIEKRWTIKEIFEHFNVEDNEEIKNSDQILAGIRIMKKNKNLIKLINLESDALYSNSLLFTNHYNENQSSYFADNRHDQSIFSVIRKIHNPIGRDAFGKQRPVYVGDSIASALKKSLYLGDETYFNPFGDKASLRYPFWAVRKR